MLFSVTPRREKHAASIMAAQKRMASATSGCHSWDGTERWRCAQHIGDSKTLRRSLRTRTLHAPLRARAAACRLSPSRVLRTRARRAPLRTITLAHCLALAPAAGYICGDERIIFRRSSIIVMTLTRTLMHAHACDTYARCGTAHSLPRTARRTHARGSLCGTYLAFGSSLISPPAWRASCFYRFLVTDSHQRSAARSHGITHLAQNQDGSNVGWIRSDIAAWRWRRRGRRGAP